MKLLPFIILAGFLTLSTSASAFSQQKPDEEFRRLLKEAIESKSGFIDKFDAKVWLFDMSSRLAKRARHIPLKERMELLKAVHREATKSELSPQLVLALIDTESSFDHYAVSKSGARGLMQIMPFWVKEIGHDNDNLFDIDTNLRYGCTILSLYLKRSKQNRQQALARYNGSYGSHKYSNKVLSTLKKHWFVNQ